MNRRTDLVFVTSVFWVLCSAGSIGAQTTRSPSAAAVPQRPAASEVTVRAVRVTEPIKIDGKLDDAVYAAIPPITTFIQQDPHEGEPATEKTEAWILFDDDNLYVSARCWDSHPEREVVN